MAVKSASTPEAVAELLSASHVERIGEAEVLQRIPRLTAATSLRLSVPLLNALDALATAQHRTRSNLIQHILWEYLLGRREAEA